MREKTQVKRFRAVAVIALIVRAYTHRVREAMKDGQLGALAKRLTYETTRSPVLRSGEFGVFGRAFRTIRD